MSKKPAGLRRACILARLVLVARNRSGALLSMNGAPEAGLGAIDPSIRRDRASKSLALVTTTTTTVMERRLPILRQVLVLSVDG